MVIICGDTQLRVQTPYYEALLRFFSWCHEQPWNAPENTFIHLGDFFDSSALNGQLVSTAQNIWSKIRCKKMLLEGNHDTSRRLGSALDFLKDQDVQVIQQVYDTKIDNARYLFLPHPRTRDIEEQYRSLTGKYDFVFGHFATLPLFGHEIALNEDLEYRHRLFGHVHIPDKNDPVYLGVPVAQAYGEDSFTHKLACIDHGVLSYLDIPSFLEFKTVSYATTDHLESEVNNVFFVYDIIDAPSVKLAYEKFGNVPIRKVTTLLSQDAPEVSDKNVLEHGRENLIEEFLNQYDKPSVANKLKALFAS